MINYECIKIMTVDEMVELLMNRSCCDTCICDMEENKCMVIGCKDGIKQWLESEGEMDKDCTTCKNAYIKDGVYLICDIDGIQNDTIKNCKNYEEDDNA